MVITGRVWNQFTLGNVLSIGDFLEWNVLV